MESGKEIIVTAMTVKMCAEIISFDGGLMRGELRSQYLEEPYLFSDPIRMIEKMEKIFDSKGFPQAFMKPRSFGDATRPSRKKRPTVKKSMEELIEIKTTEGLDVSKCTFEIAVRFRQNATWQGQITWAEKNLKQNFRSVLEMLRLMDEALMEDAQDKKLVGW